MFEIEKENMRNKKEILRERERGGLKQQCQQGRHAEREARSGEANWKMEGMVNCFSLGILWEGEIKTKCPPLYQKIFRKGK